MREAFAKLSFREQTLLEKRSAICMTCGRVVPLNERASFEDLAIEFESSSPRTAEHAAPGGYRYQADNDGEWGEFSPNWTQPKPTALQRKPPVIRERTRVKSCRRGCW